MKIALFYYDEFSEFEVVLVGWSRTHETQHLASEENP